MNYLDNDKDLIKGESVFYLIDGDYFDVVEIKRVEEVMIVWEEFNDIANKVVERKDFKGLFVKKTRKNIKYVNWVNRLFADEQKSAERRKGLISFLCK